MSNSKPATPAAVKDLPEIGYSVFKPYCTYQSGYVKFCSKRIECFFSKMQSLDYSIQAVTKDELTQARAKLKPEVFIELNNEAVLEFYQTASYRFGKHIAFWQ